MAPWMIHPRCERCRTTFCRRIRSDEPCASCGATAWRETHQAAFHRVEERSDGWYGVQDYEAPFGGETVEVYVAGDWRPAVVSQVEAGGGLRLRQRVGDVEQLPVEGEGYLWRWPGSREGDRRWVGPFTSRVAADSVRQDGAPGYLVCGLCGWDGWKTELPGHYQTAHGDAVTTRARRST